MIIPYQQLSADALQSLLESHITQQGMDQFDTRYSLAEKTTQLRNHLESGDVVIVFDVITESSNILTKEAARPLLDIPTGDEK